MFWTLYQALNFCDITKQERIPPGEAFPSDWVGIAPGSTTVFVSFSMATSQVSEVFFIIFIIFDPLA